MRYMNNSKHRNNNLKKSNSGTLKNNRKLKIKINNSKNK